MATCVTPDELRALVNVTPARGWTNELLLSKLALAQARVQAQLVPLFGAATVAVWLASSATCPDQVKALITWECAAGIFRETKGYRTQEGEPNPGAVWASEARKLLDELRGGTASVIGVDGTEYRAASTVIHHNAQDRSIFGGVEGMFPGVKKDDEA